MAAWAPALRGGFRYDDAQGTMRRVSSIEQLPAARAALIADCLIGHEQTHQDQCRRSVEAGLTSEWNNPVFVAEGEVKADQAGIDSLELGLSRLQAQCGVAMSGPEANPSQALASRPDLPSLQQEAQRAAQAFRKGWS